MITFDSRQFLAAMAELKKEVPLEMVDIMRWQMALWCRDIIKRIGGNPSASFRAQKQKGKAAISKDLRNVFEMLESSSKVYDTNKRSKRKTNVYGMPLVKTESGGIYLIDSEKYMPTASLTELSEVHRKHRNSQGRVKHELPSRRLKGLRVAGKYVVKAAILKRYVKEVQKHVGRTKACWLKALNYFEQRSKGLAKWQPPQWVRKSEAVVAPFSVVSEEFNAVAMTGNWTAGSNLAYGRDPKGAVAFGFTKRMRDLQGGWALKRLAGKFAEHQPKEARAA